VRLAPIPLRLLLALKNGFPPPIDSVPPIGAEVSPKVEPPGTPEIVSIPESPIIYMLEIILSWINGQDKRGL
jgi:hypothetical protein